MRILYLPDAAADVQETFEWYERKRRGLGREFLGALEVAEDELVRSPTAYRTVHRDTRRFLLRRFPYQILFRVMDDQIVIVGCFHVRRSPRVIRGR